MLHAKEDIYSIAVFEIECQAYRNAIAVEAAMAWVGGLALRPSSGKALTNYNGRAKDARPSIGRAWRGRGNDHSYLKLSYGSHVIWFPLVIKELSPPSSKVNPQAIIPVYMFSRTAIIIFSGTG